MSAPANINKLPNLHTNLAVLYQSRLAWLGHSSPSGCRGLELREGHLAGLADCVVEQGSTPQCWVSPEQNTMDAGQAFLCGVKRLQVVLLPAHAAAPWLVAVVDATEIMCALWTETRTIFIVVFEKDCNLFNQQNDLYSYPY